MWLGGVSCAATFLVCAEKVRVLPIVCAGAQLRGDLGWTHGNVHVKTFKDKIEK